MGSRDIYVFENQSSIPPPIPDLFADFFRSWEDPNSNPDDYLSFFAPDAHLIFSPSISAKGRDGIRAFRDNMINPERGPVVALQHTVDKCWLPAGATAKSGKVEVIITGNIWYKLKNGRKIGGNFASMVVFEDNEKGRPEATLYEVYLDTLEFTNALSELEKEGK